jgi:small subunit ribosomal protein S5
MARSPGGRRGERGDRGDRPPQQAEESDLSDKLVAINRVAKVVKGGRRFSFAALVVVGDGRGRVGFGTGKAREVPEAIRKATDHAKHHMIKVPLRDGRTLHHDVEGHYGAGRVILRSAPAGTGVIAGGPMRAVFETMGVQDVVAKSVGTSNPHNMVKATFHALQRCFSPRNVAARRGKRVGEIIARRGEVAGASAGAGAGAERAARGS